MNNHQYLLASSSSDALFDKATENAHQAIEQVGVVIQESTDWAVTTSFMFAGTIAFFVLAINFVKSLRDI